VGSIPIASTLRAHGFTFGGLIAGEGCFSVARQPASQDGTPRLRFVFSVCMASRDRPLLEALQAFLGVGSVYDSEPGAPNWQPTSTFSVGSRRSHRLVTIPFAERYLLPSAKRRQFDAWRQRFDAYEAEHPSRWGDGPSPCSVPGCGKPVRGRGLCRAHYYRVTGY
jgi:hypothetical protein